MNDFWSLLDKGSPDGCWTWTKCTSSGYGITYITGSAKKAHRHAYELANGPIPAGAVICHTCDNPPCCNPAHLFAGTVADNWHDAIRKGRAVLIPPPMRGAKHPSAKLSEDERRQVLQMKENGMSMRGIGRHFEVSECTIRHIVDPTLSGKRWEIRKAGRLAGTMK